MRRSAAVREFLEWDVRNWAVALEFWTGHTRLDLRSCSALEVGSRHGGLSLWLATLGARVVCSDLEGPTARARAKHAAAGVAARVRYESIDATRIPYAERFDLVVFK
ncbi:MAG TPA: methyltransferase domain-containing protein, partial [Gemmatimonadales bacterium]|nr:methyltransferase domain-containing protein [Gemmatimonadales bacterium]